MKEYAMNLCGVTRTLPFIPINDDLAFASFVVLSDTELISACASELAKQIGEVDAILTAEAKIVKKAAILAEGKAADRDDIIFLRKLPLFKKTQDGYEPIA